MKLFNIHIFFIALVALTLMVACNKEEGISPGSNLSTEEPQLSDLDVWIKENFTAPYNIEVAYKWQESLIDQGRFLYPPHIDSVQPALEIMKKLWIEPYNNVSGTEFVQQFAPRQIVLVGGLNINPGANTVTLGEAEAGKRVTLFNIDLLNKSSRTSINRFIKTTQHEYIHILNQTKPFDMETYDAITPEGRTAQWFNENDENSRIKGFISAYARFNAEEDFAEMVAAMLTRSRAEWNTLINGINSSMGVAGIRKKEQIIVEYYQDKFKVDFYELQDSVYNATIRLLN